jgi:hypothetical protein
MTDKKDNINWDSINKLKKEMGETSWNKRYYNYSIESTSNDDYNYLSTYSTKERALEVMSDMRTQNENNHREDFNEKLYFYMPKENEDTK